MGAKVTPGAKEVVAVGGERKKAGCESRLSFIN